MLKGEITPARRPIHAQALLQRVVADTEAERRMRGVSLSAERIGADGLSLTGDEELLAASIGALVVAPPALLSVQNARSVSLTAAVRSDGAVAFVADHEGAELPLFWRSILAEDDVREGTVPGGTAVTSALTLLRASRYVAELHGGRLTVDCSDGLTSLSIAIPPSSPGL